MPNDQLRVSLQSADLVLKKQLILNQLTVEFKSTGISLLVGENGAGKTQILRTIHGLAQLDSGSVNAPPKNRQAFLYQNPQLLQRSVKDNLRFIRNSSVSSGNYFDAHFETVLRLFELERLLTHPVKQLSGGQQKRVALARLFLQEAECFLLDEPTANMDWQTIQLIEQAIEKLIQKNQKVIIATHDILHIERLFKNTRDELLMIKNGQLLWKTDHFSHEKLKQHL